MTLSNAKGHRSNGAQSPNARLSTLTKHVNSTAPTSVGQSLRFRFAAALRCEPLESGHTDPWPSNSKGCNVSVTETELDKWAWTISELLTLGMPPLPSIEVQRALWLRGGDDRRLIDTLRSRLGAVA